MELVGDFTTLTLLEVCQQKGGNFADRAKAIQQRLTEDEKGNASHQVFMNEENPEYAEIQEIRKKVVAAFILKVYGNNVDSLTPNDNIVINSNGKVEQ